MGRLKTLTKRMVIGECNYRLIIGRIDKIRLIDKITLAYLGGCLGVHRHSFLFYIIILYINLLICSLVNLSFYYSVKFIMINFKKHCKTL